MFGKIKTALAGIAGLLAAALAGTPDRDTGKRDHYHGSATPVSKRDFALRVERRRKRNKIAAHSRARNRK